MGVRLIQHVESALAVGKRDGSDWLESLANESVQEE